MINASIQKHSLVILGSICFISLILIGAWLHTPEKADGISTLEALEQRGIKNNHYLVTLLFSSLNSNDIPDYQHKVAHYLSDHPLREYVKDYQLQNIFLHSLVGLKSLEPVQKLIYQVLNETILNPYDNAQKLTALYIILRSQDQSVFIQNQNIITTLSQKSDSDDIRKMAQLLIENPPGVKP